MTKQKPDTSSSYETNKDFLDLGAFIDGNDAGISPDEHQRLAYVTAPKSYQPLTHKQFELIHAILGLVTELGELADPIKKHVIYGKPLDETNILEEAGDMDWYAGLILTAIHTFRSDVMSANIAKLKRRYPNGYSEQDAVQRADKVEPLNIIQGMIDAQVAEEEHTANKQLELGL